MLSKKQFPVWTLPAIIILIVIVGYKAMSIGESQRFTIDDPIPGLVTYPAGVSAPDATMKCPEDYASTEESATADTAYYMDYLERNPDATIEDVGVERMKFLTDNNCQKTLDYMKNNLPEDSAIEPLTATEEELKQYKETLTNPYVVHVRTALNGYLDGSNEGMWNPDLTINKHEEGEYISGLAAFDKSYYRSKFVVLAVKDFVGGGKEINIIFQDKPDTLFSAWVYSPGGGASNHYDLRKFWQKQGWGPKEMSGIQTALSSYLYDPQYGV